MRKNLLLSSTAIVGASALLAVATPASADTELTISGQVEFGVSAADEETINDDSNRGYFFFMDSETELLGEGSADNGVNYSGKVELEVDADDSGDNVNADEAVVALWGGFGRVELGREDGAEDVMFVGGEDFQAGTGGIDGDPQNLALPASTDSGDAAKVTYFTPRIAGFQLGGSFTPDTGDGEDDATDDAAGDIEEHFGLGANFVLAAGGADVTLAGTASIGDNEDGDGDDLEDYAIGAGVEFAGLGLGAGYVLKEDLDEGDAFTLGATYGFGPANVSAGYSLLDLDDADDEESVIAVSADYALFPGVTMKGDLAFNDEDSDAGGDSTTAGVVTLQFDY